MITFVFLVAFSGCTRNETSQPAITATETQATAQTTESRVVEAGCATCIFDMPGVTGCKLAVKIDDKSYLVVGSSMDDHGDAHAATGLCVTARKAKTVGTIKGDEFIATSFALQP